MPEHPTTVDLYQVTGEYCAVSFQSVPKMGKAPGEMSARRHRADTGRRGGN